MLRPGRRARCPRAARSARTARCASSSAALRLDASVVVAGEKRHVFLDGRSYQLSRVDPLYQGGEGQGAEGGLAAPMPGKVIAWLAQPGTEWRRARRS